MEWLQCTCYSSSTVYTNITLVNLKEEKINKKEFIALMKFRYKFNMTKIEGRWY